MGAYKYTSNSKTRLAFEFWILPAADYYLPHL